MLSGEATQTNCIVFGLIRLGLEPTIYRSLGEHASHYTIDVKKENEDKIHNFFIDFIGVGIVCFNKRFDLLLSKNKNLESEQFYNAVNVIMDTSHNEFKRIPLYLLVETPSFKKFVKAQNLIKE